MLDFSSVSSFLAFGFGFSVLDSALDSALGVSALEVSSFFSAVLDALGASFFAATLGLSSTFGVFSGCFGASSFLGLEPSKSILPTCLGPDNSAFALRTASRAYSLAFSSLSFSSSSLSRFSLKASFSFSLASLTS